MVRANEQLSENLVQPLTEARNAAFQDFAALAQGNAGALAAAQASPQAIGTGFGYTIRDLRSISNGAWSGAAPMEAALIYYVRRISVHVVLRCTSIDQDRALLTPRSSSLSTLPFSAASHV